MCTQTRVPEVHFGRSSVTTTGAPFLYVPSLSPPSSLRRNLDSVNSTETPKVLLHRSAVPDSEPPQS